MNTTLLDRAIIFATRAHQGQERRGKGLPYIVHPLEALTIVATLTNDQEILAATVLHDTVEDTPVTLNEIRIEFGERVAQLVSYETSLHPSNGGTWRSHKQATLDRLAAAPHDAKIAAIGDKLSNLRTLALDYQAMGDELWNRFHAPKGKEDVAWYYQSLGQALKELAGLPPYEEYLALLARTFGE